MPRAVSLPADERRAALVAATAPLLVTHGRNVSTRQIAAAAGVAEGTIFRVFESKESLIDAVVEEAFDVGPTCRQLDEIDPNADLELCLTQAVTLLQQRLARVFSLMHALALPGEFQRRERRPDPDAHTRHRRDNELLNETLARLIEPHAAELRFDPLDAASLIKTLTFAVGHPILSDHRHTDPKQIVDIALHGLSAPNCSKAASLGKDSAAC